MDDTCKSILIGSALGDGHITRIRSKKGTSSLYVKYSPKSKEYINWLYNSLKPIGVGKLQKRKNGQRQFNTRVSVEIGKYRKLFYPDGIKIVPRNIKELLTDPLSLAVWYMDDGTLDFRELYHCNISIATYGFTFQECKLLTDMLWDNFGVKSSVTKCTMRGKVYPRLYLWTEGTSRFLDLVEPYVSEISCMHHKIITPSLYIL